MVDKLKGVKDQPYGEPTKSELETMHRYRGDVLADGFVSPLVLPCERLKDLQGDDSVSMMADRCHIPTRELAVLLENDWLEPNARQLYSISRAYGVSILWLLGYHAAMDLTFSGGDRALMNTINKRNATEMTLNRVKQKGILGDLFKHIIERRLHRHNLAVTNMAARLIAAQHLPLSEQELYLMCGQPVFIEYPDGEMEWGLVEKGTIHTVSSTLDIADSGAAYQAYQTPDTAVSSFE